MSQEELLEIKRRIDEDHLITRIAADLHICYATIFNHFSDYIRQHEERKRIAKEEVVLEAYARLGRALYVTRETGISWGFIQATLKKHNVPIYDGSGNTNARIHPIDDGYFNKIDSEEKAYFFGLFLRRWMRIRSDKPQATIVNNLQREYFASEKG